MTVAIGQMTDDQIKQMLKALAAKAGLDYGEIVGAYAKRRTNIANELLAVHRQSESATFTSGVSSKAANWGHFKTGQRKWRGTVS